LSFLPSAMPEVARMQICARFRPAREVAGDFYDVFRMMNGRKLGFFLGDVTDKGVGAALFMALTRSLLRAFAEQNRNINWADTLFDNEGLPGQRSQNSRMAISANALKTAVVSTNDYITEFHLDLNMFATLFFGMLDPSTGSLFYINGGHCPPFILDKNGEIKERLEPTGPAVGMFPGAEFEITETKLDHGETLFLYTDGVTDARNLAGKFFSEKGLVSLVTLPVESATLLLDRVDNTLRNFIGEAVQFDDITMMALYRE
jgi:sigma-B regulation protein RsbU (phosphoserine phosphatase)